MTTQSEIISAVGIDENLATQIRSWSNEVLEKTGPLSPPPNLSITIWKTTEELQKFYRKEKEELGVVTGEEASFLATHEAWRGYPRIHICQERISGISDAVVQGVIHHEISHALHHGSPEFYTFRFSNKLQEVAISHGLDIQLLQQCVYAISVAIKDKETIQWLADIGLGFSQCALLEYLISDTEEDRRTWEMVRHSPVLRKIALAAFLKTLLPIETMTSMGLEEAQTLRQQWSKTYRWLSEMEQAVLFQFAQRAMYLAGKTFQERLELATLHLITESPL